MPVFFYLKYEDVDANTHRSLPWRCCSAAAAALSAVRCPGRGMAINITRAYSGMFAIRHGAILTILDLPFSLVFDTLLLPLDASHGPYN